MKRIFILLLAIVTITTGCKKDEKTSKELETSPEKVVELENVNREDTIIPKEDTNGGKALSPLTGLYIPKEDTLKRPIAVVINNLDKALPQSGISGADIYYEVLAEGGITRLILIFQNPSSEKIGPIRSARDYFTSFSIDNNAIFVHHGGSPMGYSIIKEMDINNIDGMNSTEFYRDKIRAVKPGMYEHSSYISGEGIYKAIDYYSYSLENTSKAMLSFNKEEKDLLGSLANKLTLTYSTVQSSVFTYEPQRGVYTRSQNGSPHIDEETGDTIEVKNILVQYTNTYPIEGDDAARIGVDLIGKGEGLYFTKGSYEAISWSKSSRNSITKWYDKDGKEIILNSGKTFICVFPNNLEAVIE